ncbi:anhydro-N-acetylmuramic acid kinase [Galbibacter mesophilus]|uniref:anhydro-N-acetylmuramic acid kinase n=1 Tax=Galbibacter mesophilus TaxID=379069 RepID=UPI00191E6F46|nr:anhydro-N-acetylmuramic acid kinase [Galbibacter mesophilus]MCM5661774.1 anhydro-N-acetylmuramic acid kinase [Galbibacter mesophilus]
METQNYNVIGVMSGTSLDGIDLVYVQFTKSEKWNFLVKHAETIDYNDEWRKVLKGAIYLNEVELAELDKNYTKLLSEIIQGFKSKNKISEVDFVASHGHTVFHKPEKGEAYQIGNLPMLADATEEKVVCDFRVADVKLGGQGAPLVPIGDKLLFGEYDYCLNLGGFANISFEENGVRKAFDICAVNTVLNHYVAKLDLPYDNKGELAATGTLHEGLLSELNDLAYYKKAFPKSLGIEWVESDVFPLIDSYNSLQVVDILRTYVEHASIQIANVVSVPSNVLVTGGGAYNSFLIKRIKALSKAIIVIPNKNIVEFKEAIIFGLLGVLRIREEVNCLSSITGATKDHSSGQVYHPKS